MNQITYLKEPGILYDMLFALKLRFNGERAYLPLRTGTLTYEEDEKFYHKIIDKLSDIPDSLLPLFYYDSENDVKTAMFTYVHDYIDLTTDGVIEYFYESLRDVDRLKRVVYRNYISPECPESFESSVLLNINKEVLNSFLPHEMKMYLLNFFLYGDDEVNEIIDTLRKVESFCIELHNQHLIENQVFSESFGTEQIEYLSDRFDCDIITQYGQVYFSFCSAMINGCQYETYDTKYLVLLGTHITPIFYAKDMTSRIDLYQLGSILHDKQRLRIIEMLSKEDMYCAEIARKLGLKNNSTLHHLIIMEKEGLLATWKKVNSKKNVYYTINRRYINTLKNLLETTFNGDKINEKN